MPGVGKIEKKDRNCLLPQFQNRLSFSFIVEKEQETKPFMNIIFLLPSAGKCEERKIKKNWVIHSNHEETLERALAQKFSFKSIKMFQNGLENNTFP